ncbi:MAG: prepilin-type N-terminal cleavage/methylation domain-containing protein [Verrucomicrobia bacterium]|nr:prepilin-type N-terminal cleavage/methylation domain-containing protein [Verrucomicrobiota bacterium]MBU1910441.1 prepilin-type N-terminal cleavage/methylation domain-containing protein [Verrucomicrobiota bacterium]
MAARSRSKLRAARSRSRLRASTSGLTLIELLLAVAIAGLLLGVVYALYHTVTAAVSGRRVRDDELGRAGRAIETISQDFAALFPGPAEDCNIRLNAAEGADPNRSEMAFCTFRLPGGETDPRWLEVCRVTYRVDSEDVLLCVRRPLAGPGAEAEETNDLVAGVSGFRVSLYDGAEWKAEWGDSAEKNTPLAARVELEMRRGPRTFRTEMLIPAGGVFTSRLERAVASP